MGKIIRCPDCGGLVATIFPIHVCKKKRDNDTLVCSKCGVENWNLASEGKRHDQPANKVKGYEACNGVWIRRR